MSRKIPDQQFPIIDPEPATTDNRYSYYILEEPNSPSVAPPNALRVVQYRKRQFLHGNLDDEDYRRPYGYVEYSHELSFTELDEYNLLPFDPDQITLFDLWQSFEKDRTALLSFFNHFFKMVESDPESKRLVLAIKLVGRKWTLKMVKETIKRIL